MKCKEAEKLIISLNELNEKEKHKLESHLADCPKCKKFKIQYEILHKKIRKEKFSTPSAKLQQETRLLCHQEMSSQHGAKFINNSNKIPLEIPLLARIILITFIALILSWGIPVFRNFLEKDILTGETIYLFIILVQNILALLFAPILLKFLKMKKQALTSA